MNYTNKLIVKPGTKVRLNQFDPASHGHGDAAQEAGQELEAVKAKIGALQRQMYGDNQHSLLIVLQGLDAAGKDGVCWHVISGMDPQGCKVQGFKAPTAAEAAHDFLWRIHPHAPGKGEVAVFNRSHYEDVLVVRVDGLAPEARWKKRFEHINAFEKMLVDEGTTVLKFFLHISKDEQKERLQERLDDPSKNWKFDPNDLKVREKWDAYQRAYEDVLSQTSTEAAPWYIVPANKKWYRNLVITEVLVATLERLGLHFPAAPDLANIKVV